VAMIVTGVLVAIKLFTDADLEKHRVILITIVLLYIPCVG